LDGDHGQSSLFPMLSHACTFPRSLGDEVGTKLRALVLQNECSPAQIGLHGGKKRAGLRLTFALIMCHDASTLTGSA